MSGPADARSDRRQHIRVNANLRLSVRTAGDLEFFDAQMQNISEGGLMFTTNAELPVGREIELEMMLPTTLRIVRLKGKVVWNRKTETVEGTNYEAGIRIVEINEMNFKDIKEAIEQLTRGGN